MPFKRSPLFTEKISREDDAIEKLRNCKQTYNIGNKFNNRRTVEICPLLYGVIQAELGWLFFYHLRSKQKLMISF